MVEPKHSVSRVRETLYTAIASFSLVSAIIAAIAKIVPYFQRAEVVYFTQELSAYPIPYQGNKPVPADIQGKVLVGGPVKILSLVVRNKGERSASDVVVRIPLSTDDKFLGGWMTKSKAPSTVYMLGTGTEYRFNKLMPDDVISFCLYLKSANSSLANRIEVFDGDGHRAAYYPYVPVRYAGSDGVIIALRKSWIYVFGFILVAVPILGVSRMRKPKPAVSADGRNPADAGENLPTSSLGSTAGDQFSREGPPSRRTAGRR